MGNILLLSKEILKVDYLSCYGGNLYKTKNIDKLAKKNTVFKNFYTAAPSSAMSFTSMFTGLNPYETDRALYQIEEIWKKSPTLSHELVKKNYEIHVIWGGKWYKKAHKRSRVFCEGTHYHNLQGIYQQIGTHFKKGIKIKPDTKAKPLDIITNEIDKIFKEAKKDIFIWLHCPHVFLGRIGYGSDIDLFDDLVGRLFEYFNFDEIFLTADHGHMNCEKGIPVYGAHVYESAIHIPLITPNYFQRRTIEDIVSNTQLKNIILNHKFSTSEFIYSDTQYYLQENRKLMIRSGDYKYIFNKRDSSEELYDIKFDPNEEVNLLIENWYDWNRNKNYYLEEVYYYPHWNTAKRYYEKLLAEKDRIWKTGSISKELKFKLYNKKQKGLANLYPLTIKKDITEGRWNSTAARCYYRQ